MRKSTNIYCIVLALSLTITPVQSTPILSGNADYTTVAKNLLIDSIVADLLKPVIDSVLGTLSNWLTIDLTSTALSQDHFSTINNAYLLVTCVDGKCTKKSSRGTSTDIFFDVTVKKTGSYNGVAELQTILQDTAFTNPFCLGPIKNKSSLNCTDTVRATSNEGKVFLRDSSAIYYGLIYDGEGSGSLQVVDGQDTGKIYVSEPSSILLAVFGIALVGFTRKMQVFRHAANSVLAGKVVR